MQTTPPVRRLSTIGVFVAAVFMAAVLSACGSPGPVATPTPTAATEESEPPTDSTPTDDAPPTQTPIPDEGTGDMPFSGELSRVSDRVEYGSSEVDLTALEADPVEVNSGDVIRVTENGVGRLNIAEALTLDIFSNSELEVTQGQAAAQLAEIRLDLGGFLGVHRGDPGGEVLVETLAGAEVRASDAIWFVVHDVEEGFTIVCTFEGTVDVTAQGQAVQVSAGLCTTVEAAQPPTEPAPFNPVYAGADPTAFQELSLALMSVVQAGYEFLPRPVVAATSAPGDAGASPGAGTTTTEVQEVWYCEEISPGYFEWYEVEIIYEDGAPVQENVLSGPYNGPWQPNCPVVTATQPPPTPEDGYGAAPNWDDPFVAAMETRSEGHRPAMTVTSALLSMLLVAMGASLMIVRRRE